MSGRLAGMLVAGLLAGAVLALIGVAVLTAPPPVQQSGAPAPGTSTGASNPGTGLDPRPDDPGPDQSAGARTPTDIGSLGADPTAAIGRTGKTVYRLTDEEGNLLAEMAADSFNPVERGVLEAPTLAVTYFREDRVVRILADRARIRGQRGETPDAGELEGNVSVSLYPAGATQDDARAHESGEGGVAPELVFTTNAMRFDTVLGEGVADGQVRIEAPGVRLDGRGLTLRIGTQTGAQDPQLLLVRLEESDGLRLWPDRLPTSDRKHRATADAPPATPPGAGGTSQPAPEPTVYRFAMNERVAISRGTYTARADEIVAHARLFGGALRDGAITPLRLRESGETDAASARETGAPAREARAPADAAPFDAEQPILVTWNGPLELRPVRQAPGVLDFDDVVVRFNAEEEGGVRLGDDLADVALTAREITYFASSAYFEARAREPDAVRLDADRIAQLVCSSLDVDLSQSPAIRTIVRTPGVVTDDAGRRIAWRGGATLDADLGEDRLLARALVLTGGVDLVTGNGESANADTLAVAFDDEGRPGSIEATGDVEAAQERTRRAIAGDTAILELAPDGPRDIALTRATITGNAAARDGQRTFNGATVAAIFDSGELTTVNATGDVVVNLDDGVAIACHELRSDRVGRIIDLLGRDGEPITVTRDAGGVALTATVGSARIEEERERITGFGPGAGALTAIAPGAQYERADLAWLGGFVFDGAAQRLEMLGGVDVEARKDDDETHTASAERAEIDLTGVDTRNARVTGARLYAGPGPGGEEIPARAEARRTREDATAASGRTLESLIEVRSGELLVDVEAQRVNAPGAGRLVVEDRREDVRRNADSAPDTRGTSVFHWAGAMTMSLDAGDASMRRDVRVRHLPRSGDALTQLDCQRLDAFFREDASAGSVGFAVERLEARESVYAAYRGLELLADALVYRATTDQIVATSSEGNRVTIVDPDRDGHFVSTRVLIDLATGNWTSEGAGGGASAGAGP